MRPYLLPPRILERVVPTGGLLLGCAIVAYLVLMRQSSGLPTPARVEQVPFQVAMLVGARQSQTVEAPVQAATEIQVSPSQQATAVEQEESTSALPKAVAAAADATPAIEAHPEVKEEVIPPARIAMPGGRLSEVEAPAGGGTEPDPFAVGPRQVYLRFFVNEQGRVVRGGIIRGGAEPLRDQFILKAMLSRTYKPQQFLKIPGHDNLWQVDLVLDYGNEEALP